MQEVALGSQLQLAPDAKITVFTDVFVMALPS